MKYMIHACPKRMWYVDNFLIPSMIEQGIKRDQIILWNDEKMEGNLPSWLKSCEFIRDNMQNEKGIWHLQDDIVLSKHFAEETKKANDIIVNGWVCVRFNKKRHWIKGEVGVLYHWNSFQSIYIPNAYIIGFLKWYYKDAVNDKFCQERIRENKWDDWLFWTYMRRNHKEDKCLNLVPNITEHIDQFIGGSVANDERQGILEGVYWEEPEVVEKLKNDIERWKKEQEAKPVRKPRTRKKKTEGESKE